LPEVAAAAAWVFGVACANCIAALLTVSARAAVSGPASIVAPINVAIANERATGLGMKNW